MGATTKKALRRAPTAGTPVFIDIFAGCGGFSLGLMQAGWSGLFAVEKDENAFASLSANLIEGAGKCKFRWPDWLPKGPLNLSGLIRKHQKQLAGLKGTIDMVVGGPPCQGFSSAGKRNPNDPRNKLVSDYLRFVKLVKPRIVLLENVRGITADFERNGISINYADRVQKALSEDYAVFSKVLDVSSFGVPQRRRRFFIIAVRKDGNVAGSPNPFEELEKYRPIFLLEKGLQRQISAQSAISDLEIARAGTTESKDTRNFEEIVYSRPRTVYQKLMRAGSSLPPSDTRLARHRPEIETRFKQIIKLCHASGRLNTSLDRETRAYFGLKKCAIRVLDPDAPAPTVTSMPDDLIHYAEPRTLTVRENARLQSFPDWFSFKGKYTTGGDRRRREVPRFTQVANAVPPLAAEAIGRVAKALLAARRWRP